MLTTETFGSHRKRLSAILAVAAAALLIAYTIVSPTSSPVAAQNSAAAWDVRLTSGNEGDEYGYVDEEFGSITNREFQHNGITYEVKISQMGRIKTKD